MSPSLTVWWAGTTVGRLALDGHGAMRFTYDGGWIEDGSAPPISFSPPKRPQSFSTRRCLPFFEGLLPEGSQRDAVAAALGVAASNTFRLLAGLGAELAGALTLLPGDAEPGESRGAKWCWRHCTTCCRPLPIRGTRQDSP